MLGFLHNIARQEKGLRHKIHFATIKNKKKAMIITHYDPKSDD